MYGEEAVTLHLFRINCYLSSTTWATKNKSLRLFMAFMAVLSDNVKGLNAGDAELALE